MKMNLTLGQKKRTVLFGAPITPLSFHWIENTFISGDTKRPNFLKSVIFDLYQNKTTIKIFLLSYVLGDLPNYWNTADLKGWYF